MKFSDDNQMTLKDLSFNSDEEIKKLDENIHNLKVCGSRSRSGSRRNSLESKSPTSSKGNGKCGRPANPVPRHKRDSHIKAEHKRRDKIQKGFDTLRDLVPSLENCSPKESKSSMLFKTAEHCRQIKGECKAQQDEALALRHEIESLGNQIHLLQGRLPAVGVKVAEKSDDEMDNLCNQYIKNKSKENWKFWMFSLLLKPLFETYKKTLEGVNSEMFVDVVGKWAEDNLSLVKLRPAMLAALRKVCTKTKIMDKPEEFQKDVQEQISLLEDGVVIPTNNNLEMKLTTTDTKEQVAKLTPAPSPQHQPNSAYQQHGSSVTQHSDLNTRLIPNSAYQQHGSIATRQSDLDTRLIPNSAYQQQGSIATQYRDSGLTTRLIPNSDLSKLVMPDFAKPDSGLTGPIIGMEQKLDDVPMTSVDLWDIPATLPSVDSFSSLSDMICTNSEDSNLFDSIMHTFCNTDTYSGAHSACANDQMNVPPLQELSDLTNDLFPTGTTTSVPSHNSSSFQQMTRENSFSGDMLTFPSFNDLEMVPTSMESSVDPLTFLIDSGIKHPSTYQNKNSFL